MLCPVEVISGSKIWGAEGTATPLLRNLFVTATHRISDHSLGMLDSPLVVSLYYFNSID